MRLEQEETGEISYFMTILHWSISVCICIYVYGGLTAGGGARGIEVDTPHHKELGITIENITMGEPCIFMVRGGLG